MPSQKNHPSLSSLLGKTFPNKEVESQPVGNAHYFRFNALFTKEVYFCVCQHEKTKNDQSKNIAVEIGDLPF